MVTINGENEHADGMTIAAYLDAHGFDAKRIAVELNGNILPKSKYENTVLQDSDSVEIVSFVGGG